MTYDIGNTAEKISAVASDGDFWVSRVLKTIALLEKDSKHLSILIEAGDEDRQLRQQAQELAERLKAVRFLLSFSVIRIRLT